VRYESDRRSFNSDSFAPCGGEQCNNRYADTDRVYGYAACVDREKNLQVIFRCMWRTILIYGLALAGLTALLKFLEYKYIVRDLSLEFYLGVVAVFFTAIGVWAGLRLTSKKVGTVQVVVSNVEIDQNKIDALGISKREMEVLELIAQGLSNQEIAEKLFVSLNTVKTHSSNLFVKLDVKRRTQAVQKAKELRIIV
jgi:two-component system, NarL family, response regulator LiaR